MSLNWKLRLSLDNRPYDPMRFLVISLFLHGAVFLGLEIYLQRMANQTLQTKLEDLIPIKFIELPPDQLAVTPPLNAKNRASNNSRAGGTKAGGKASPRLQSAVGASVGASAATTPLFTTPSKAGSNTNRLALNRHSNSSQSAATPPKRSSSSKQSLRQGSSLLGGPVSLASHNFTGTGNDLANAARIGTDPEGVDALQDINLGPYLDKLRQEVAEQRPIQGINSFKQTIISFALSRNGKVNDLRVLKSSGSTKIDEAALQAVQRAAPFNHSPESYSANVLIIYFEFYMNNHGQLELYR